MKGFKTVDEFILNAQNRKEILMVLRELIQSTELVETIKWGIPVYTVNNKNVVGLGSFKSYAGLWFYQGALLKDKARVLYNAQEKKTNAMRQWRFTLDDQLDEKLILEYINEAIENQKQNKEIKPNRNKPIVIPDKLKEAFLANRQLEICFKYFSPGKQREFIAYIAEAKRAETRQKRLLKITPLIMQNIGLNDKYRK